MKFTRKRTITNEMIREACRKMPLFYRNKLLEGTVKPSELTTIELMMVFSYEMDTNPEPNNDLVELLANEIDKRYPDDLVEAKDHEFSSEFYRKMHDICPSIDPETGKV